MGKVQARIKQALLMKGDLYRRRLQRATNAHRIGTDAWDKALAGLIKDGQVGQREDGRYFLVKDDEA
jgi:hypothetical protein